MIKLKSNQEPAQALLLKTQLTETATAIAEVKEEIESLQGAIRWLRNRGGPGTTTENNWITGWNEDLSRAQSRLKSLREETRRLRSLRREAIGALNQALETVWAFERR